MTPEHDYFLVNGDFLRSPVMEGERPSSATLGLLLWMACHGQAVTVHFDDLTEGTNLHPRSVKTALGKLERAGHISISGSGAIRTIEITSEFIQTSGSWASARAGFTWAKGGSKWRVTPISTKLRRQVFQRDGEVCAYCGDTTGPFHIDHRKPVAKGGKDTLGNLTVACRSCNLSKGCKTTEEWKGKQ